MKVFTSCLLSMLLPLFVLVVAATNAQAQVFGPFEWKVSEGGNGHFYEFVCDPNNMVNWTQANDLASARTYMGQKGHLVTVTSPEEDQFIFDSFSKHFTPSVLTWIGLTDAGVEGDYEWVTGEEFDFTKWLPGEPNNLTHGGQFPNGEDWVHYQILQSESWGWNDAVHREACGFIVEYPATVVLIGDANNNGEFNNLDIVAFVLALTDAKLYAALFPEVDPDLQLDMNGDGVFNNLDISGFVAALTGRN